MLVLVLLARRLSPQLRTAVVPKLHRLEPWFIAPFLLLATLRTLNLIPDALLHPVILVTRGFTTISMAALGLGVDVRVIAKTGLRVSIAVTLSLLVLGGITLVLIHFTSI